MLHPLIAGVIIGLILAVLHVAWDWRRDRRRMVERRRDDARQLASLGYKTHAPWTITGPQDEVLIDCEFNTRLARTLAAEPPAPAGTTMHDPVRGLLISDGLRWHEADDPPRGHDGRADQLRVVPPE